jgi:GNAT superfamily N-acetyltransferase
VIRPMEYKEIKQVLRMWKELLDLTGNVNSRYRLAPDALALQADFFTGNRIDPNHFCYVAQEAEDLVGFANGYLIMPSRLFVQEPIGLIENIFVNRDRRRLGLGSDLVNACYQWFEKRKVNDVYVNVVPANGDSVEFWKAKGYDVHKMTMARSIKQR